MAVWKYASTSVSSSFSSVGTCAPKDKQLLHGSKEYEAMLVSYMYNSHVIADFYAKTKYSSYARPRINCSIHTAESVNG
jgi:hypothetical protein